MEAPPISRRRLLQGLGTAATALFVSDLAACSRGDADLVVADVRRSAPRAEAASTVTEVACAFSLDLLRRVTATGNLVCSPFSALVALAMVRNGAVGQTAQEMDQTLHLPTVARLNAGLNTATQTLDRLNGTRRRPDGSKATVSVTLVNSVWGQTGSTWEQPFLTALASSYGTGVRELDFAADPERATRRVNAWVEKQTSNRIKQIVPPRVIRSDTRMVLANALHLKAGWREALSRSTDSTFDAPDGPVTVPWLAGVVQGTTATSPHWTSARVPCAGDQLAMTVLLPARDLETLLAKLTADELSKLLVQPASATVDLALPAFSFGSEVRLTQSLQELGMSTPFSDAAEFPGITTQESLKIDQVLHQGWVAVDEDGMEAAAATVVTMVPVSGSAQPDRSLVLDDPFLFCIHDTILGTPLVLGVVNDPTQH